MANRNISATVQIGATMASSVGAVFGRLGKQIDTLGSSLAKLKKASGDVVKLQAAQGKLGEAKAKGNAAATARYAAQVDKLSASLTAAGVDTSQLAREQARLAQSIGDVEQRLGRVQRIGNVFSRLKTDAKAVGDAFGGLRDKLGGVLTRMGVVAGVVGGAVAGVGYLTAEFIDQGDTLADQADALNMSTAALQTWQFAAGTVGIETERLGMFFSKLQSKISEGSDGTEEAFKALGINFSKLSKLKPEEQLTHIAEAFSRLPDGIKKTELVNGLFGKSAYKLIPILNAGAAGLKGIYEQAKAAGYILDGDTKEAAEKADAAFNQLKIQLIGFKNKSLAPLLPVFGDMIGQLGKIITEHGPKFTKWIQTAGKEFMEKLAPAIGSFVTKDLPPLIDNIGAVVAGLVSTSSWLANVVGGWGNLGVALVAVNFVPVIASVVSLTASLWSLSGATLAAAGPWGLIIAGVLGVTYVITQFKDEIHDLIDSAIDPLLAKLQAVGDWFGKSQVGGFFGLDKYNLDGTPQAPKAASRAIVPFQSSQAMSADLMKKIMPAEKLTADGISSSAIMPSQNMPAAGNVNNVKQDFQINVTAPSANPAVIGESIKSALKSMKLYDTTGTLVPQ